MASQEQVKAMFNGMNTEQKGQFINNLKKSVEANNSAENIQLLDECMAQYKKELGAIARQNEIGIAQPLEATPEYNPGVESVNMPQPMNNDDFNTIEALSGNTAAPTANKHRIGNIDMGISELYDNIRRNMSMIETISLLLSGIDTRPYDAVKQTNKQESVQFLERVGDYEKKIYYVEEKFSEIANSVRHDMNVITAISNLLSGTGDNI